jgi:hypothetical protein
LKWREVEEFGGNQREGIGGKWREVEGSGGIWRESEGGNRREVERSEGIWRELEGIAEQTQSSYCNIHREQRGYRRIGREAGHGLFCSCGRKSISDLAADIRLHVEFTETSALSKIDLPSNGSVCTILKRLLDQAQAREVNVGTFGGYLHSTPEGVNS